MKLWCGNASFHRSRYSALSCSAHDWHPAKSKTRLHIMHFAQLKWSLCFRLFLLSSVKSHYSVALLLISAGEVQLVLLKMRCDNLKETTDSSLKSEFKWKVNCTLSWKEKRSSLSKLLFEFYWKGVPKISWDKELLIACEWTSLMEILVKHMEWEIKSDWLSHKHRPVSLELN